MRQKLLFTFVFLIAFASYAQNNIVKASLLYGNAGLQYERSLGKFSLIGQAGLGFEVIDDGYKNEFTTGVAYYFEGRYYFSDKKGKMQGWHIGPGINIAETSSENGNKRYDYTTKTYGIVSGSQWIFNSHLSVEFLLGAGYQETNTNNRYYQESEIPVTIFGGFSVGYAF